MGRIAARSWTGCRSGSGSAPRGRSAPSGRTVHRRRRAAGVMASHWRACVRGPPAVASVGGTEFDGQNAGDDEGDAQAHDLGERLLEQDADGQGASPSRTCGPGPASLRLGAGSPPGWAVGGEAWLTRPNWAGACKRSPSRPGIVSQQCLLSGCVPAVTNAVAASVPPRQRAGRSCRLHSSRGVPGCCRCGPLRYRTPWRSRPRRPSLLSPPRLLLPARSTRANSATCTGPWPRAARCGSRSGSCASSAGMRRRHTHGPTGARPPSRRSPGGGHRHDARAAPAGVDAGRGP